MSESAQEDAKGAWMFRIQSDTVRKKKRISTLMESINKAKCAKRVRREETESLEPTARQLPKRGLLASSVKRSSPTVT